MPKPRKQLTPEQLTVWIARLIREENILAFYKCKPWLHLRCEVLDEQHRECQRCKAMGKYTAATTVHHKKTVRRCPWLALTKSNLEALCDECHYTEHHRAESKPQLNAERW